MPSGHRTDVFATFVNRSLIVHYPLRRKGLIGLAQISTILQKNSEALQDRASEVFRDSSQIVVCAPRRSCAAFSN